MKKFLFIPLCIIAVLSSCNQTATTDQSTSIEVNNETPESVLKTTKQFVTNEDGTVTENDIAAEVQFFASKIDFIFSTKPENNFSLVVTTKEQSPSGIKYIVKDKKYSDVFVSSGAEPQINLNAAYGSTTFM
ncbi:MAG: hypothetical protein CVU05_06445 [Bacteroidetes bacterium HGW-Bacteroidetes-21]|nr:MAG: hypothetical protein CVU05_06445 [Bacteroidetes bacterium HGW-Bacteroidetes-21]